VGQTLSAPIRVRLTLLYVVVLAAIIAGLTTFVVTRLRSDLTAERDRTLRDAAGQIAPAYRAEGRPEFRDTTRTVLPGGHGRPAGGQILDPAGRVLVSEGGPLMAAPLIGARARARALGGATVIGSRPEPHLRVVAVPAQRRGRRQVLVVAESLRDVDDSVHRVLVLLLLGGTGALALVALGGWWIARRALRPVDRITSRAEAIGVDDLSQRIAVPRVEDELAHLARTLNAMLDRLEEGVRARERLIADASHELRAPLASMRAELDVTLAHEDLDDPARAALELARDDAVRLSRIVDNLLTLARVDEGRLELLVAPHDLRDLAERAARGLRAAAAARGIAIALDGEEVVVQGDGERLEQVLANLLDNAVRHSPVGGTVRVAIQAEGAATHVVVADDGPGIPPEARERVFERFSRQDPSRPRGGAGLGLAICREIVHAHGGRIWIDARPTPGTEVHLALPVTRRRTPRDTAVPAARPATPAV
jgi:heavy metal sensor kinase